jgi:hypothetical protein
VYCDVVKCGGGRTGTHYAINLQVIDVVIRLIYAFISLSSFFSPNLSPFCHFLFIIIFGSKEKIISIHSYI